MNSVLRVGSYPTDVLNKAGFHAFKVGENRNLKTYYVSPRLNGNIIGQDNFNGEVKRFSFLMKPYPKEASILYKVYFLLQRICSIVYFSFRTIIYGWTKKFDILHIHSPMFYIIALWGKLIGKKVYISFHGEDFNRISKSKLYKSISGLFDGVFAISPHMVEGLQSIHKCPVYYIGNGVDLEEFRNLNRIRKDQIVFVGSFKPVKRHELMVDGFSMFRQKEKYRGFKLKLVGDGELVSKIKNHIANQKIENVEFLGQKSSKELLEIYNQSKIFALTSLSEGFPKVVLEALACNCVVVSTKVGSVPSIFGDDYPFYIDGDTAEDVCVALESAASKGKMMATYFEKVKAFSWDSVREQYYDIYKKDLNV